MKDLLTADERESLTIWGEDIFASFAGRDGRLAIRVSPRVHKNIDGVSLLCVNDVRKLGQLFEEAAARGEW